MSEVLESTARIHYSKLGDETIFTEFLNSFLRNVEMKMIFMCFNELLSAVIVCVL